MTSRTVTMMTHMLPTTKTLLFNFHPDKGNKHFEADVMGLFHTSQYRAGYLPAILEVMFSKPELISF